MKYSYRSDVGTFPVSFSVLKRVLTQHRIRIETLSRLLSIVAIVPRLDRGLTPRYYAALKMFEEETDLVSRALLIGLTFPDAQA